MLCLNITGLHMSPQKTKKQIETKDSLKITQDPYQQQIARIELLMKHLNIQDTITTDTSKFFNKNKIR